jgi:RNA polymerase sigma-70 factor (ECF subfamily)
LHGETGGQATRRLLESQLAVESETAVLFLSMANKGEQITELLVCWRKGDAQALDRLVPLVYGELHRLARRYLRSERRGHTLQSTALVHEAYLRLADQSRIEWQNRAHFYGVAAALIRNILVDYARTHRAAKRGGDACRLSLDAALDIAERREVDLLALDDALVKLSQREPELCRIVELRFFGGLTIEETGQVLNVSDSTVKRQWILARTWIFRELSS